MADTSTIMDRGVQLNLTDPSIYHDRVLIVGGKKFYVLSQVLSLWSEHFRRLFEGDFAEANAKEIEFKEVDAELFGMFLLILNRNSCNILTDDLVPMIGLAYRFLSPYVLEYCKKFIYRYMDTLGSAKLELLKTACLYDNKELKKKLGEHFMNEGVMSKFKAEDVLKVAIEYNLGDLKAYLGGIISKNVTLENCIEMLQTAATYDMPTLKEGINNAILRWNTPIPMQKIIELTEAAFKYDVQSLKDKLNFRIRHFCVNAYVVPGKGRKLTTFLEEYYDKIKALPEDVRDFIILASVRQ